MIAINQRFCGEYKEEPTLGSVPKALPSSLSEQDVDLRKLTPKHNEEVLLRAGEWLLDSLRDEKDQRSQKGIRGAGWKGGHKE